MAIKQNATSVEKLQKAVKAFEAVQLKYSKFGAHDTEPDGVFQATIAKTFNGTSVKIPTTPHDWQLYAGSMGCGTAARAMTAACKRVVAMLTSMKVNAEERQQVRAYLQDYCWRTDVD